MNLNKNLQVDVHQSIDDLNAYDGFYVTNRIIIFQLLLKVKSCLKLLSYYLILILFRLCE